MPNRPLPAEVVQLRPGHRSKAEVEARVESTLRVPPAEAVRTPPAYLSRAAKELWRRHVPRMVDETPELVTDRDLPALALAFEHLATAQAAAKALRGRGGHLAVLDQDSAHANRLRKNPATEILRQHSAAALSLLKEFGLTPSSRVGLRVGPLNELDDEDADDGIFDA